MERHSLRFSKVHICWLDSGSSDPELLPQLLEEIGFRLVGSEGDLQVWQSEQFSAITLEVLKVDSVPKDPASRLQGITATMVDEDRRKWCVPRQMDPYYRIAVYSVSSLRGANSNQGSSLFAVKSLLTSRFNDLVSTMSQGGAVNFYMWQS